MLQVEVKNEQRASPSNGITSDGDSNAADTEDCINDSWAEKPAGA